jgi:hypothetical protein
MTVVVEPPAAPAPRPRPAWRQRRFVLPGIAAGLVILLAGGDLTSRQVVQHVMASKMQDALETPQRPSVHLGGGPFLPQLIRGRFKSMSLDARDATACQVRIAHAHADLTGVRRSHGGAHAGSINGTGLLSYASISAAIAPMKVTGGDNGQLTISIGFTPLGLAATATMTPRIDGSTLVVDPGTLTTSVLGAQSMDLPLGGLGPIRLQLRNIPDGLGVQINPRPDGLDFTFAGKDVQLVNIPCASSGGALGSFLGSSSVGTDGHPT